MPDATSATGGFLALSPVPGLPDVEDVLHDLIVGITGLSDDLVRPRGQGEPPRTPAKDIDWCAFGITGSDPFTYPQIKHYPAGEGRDDVISHEDLAVLVSFYGPRHFGLAWDLRAGIHVPQNRSSLRPAGMAFIKAGTVTRLPELVQAGFRARADLPLAFRRVVARSVAVLSLKQSGGSLENETGVTVGFGCDGKE